MKKTLLLALLGASTLAVASGKVELKNDFSSKVTKSDQGIKFDEKKTEHVLTASVTENNITADMSLKLKGKIENNKILPVYTDGIKDGHIKVAYDDKMVAGSLKYELKNVLTAEGSYTYKAEPLTVKPAVKFVHDFKAPKLELSNHTGYVVDDKLTLGNDIIVNTNLKSEEYSSLLTVKGKGEYKFNEDVKLTDELVVEKSLNGNKKEISLAKYYGDKKKDENKIESEKAGYFSISNVFNGDIKLVKDVKLEPKLELLYTNTSIEESKAAEKAFKIKPTVKVTYTPEMIKGLKAEASVDYMYGSSNQTREVEEKNKKVNLENKTSHSLFELKGKLSYDIALAEGLKLIPTGGLTYSNSVISQGTEMYDISDKTNKFVGSLGVEFVYEINKFNISLAGTVSPVWEGTNLLVDMTKTAEISKKAGLEDQTVYKVVSKNIKVNDKKDFAYNSSDVKATLKLGYTW